MKNKLPFLIAALFAPAAWAADAHTGGGALDLTTHDIGIAALVLFVIAYGFVIAEEFLHLRKSKPVVVAAGIIWALVGTAYAMHGSTEYAVEVLRHNFLEYGELLLFLLAAMTYINTLQEREVFNALRSWLISSGFSLRSLFWLTGLLAFFISPLADNLTTALIMGAVVMAVGAGNPKFITVACINIVVAANAGGAFSPFGDITTLMVWQKGIIDFWSFFSLIIPSAVNFLVPAACMHFAIPDVRPAATTDKLGMKRGAWVIMALFLVTITTAVSFHNFLRLPPMLGMMTGLACLQIFGFYLRKTHHRNLPNYSVEKANEMVGDVTAFEVFRQISRAEWDTLLFFYGVVLCVGGLGFIGYLELVSKLMYVDMGPTFANVMVGLMSAIVDNIPVMFAVLTMGPDMSQGQWLLVTLTAGVGGSLLSIGSAAGVALMGQARGTYTFFSHLKWMPVIALGYAASILIHMWVNASQF